jgi:hypothetical protein
LILVASRREPWQERVMAGRIAALYRHPIKGFTPQKVSAAFLETGRPFPGDRLWAVEDGPSGFDPERPAHISKSRFAVLAKIPALALARTDYDVETGELVARAPGLPEFREHMAGEWGKTAFAAWLEALLGEAASGPLKVLDGAGHRFLDSPEGHVSIINLASVRDFEARIGQPVDPLRFRANLYVNGWRPWEENDWIDRELAVGDVRVKVIQPITRCAAPDVDPTTALADIEVTRRLHELYGHLWCGIYVQVTAPGRIAEGDEARLL